MLPLKCVCSGKPKSTEEAKEAYLDCVLITEADWDELNVSPLVQVERPGQYGNFGRTFAFIFVIRIFP